MIMLEMFLLGCLVVGIITVAVNMLFKKNPKKADEVINYIMFFMLLLLLSFAIKSTDWDPVEEKLSGDLNEYREAQRNAWK